MFLIRLIWLFLLGLLVRRIYQGYKRATAKYSSREPGVTMPPDASDKKSGPVTDQDISDADYEEIP